MRPGHAWLSYGFKPRCPILGHLEIANYVASLTVTHLSLRPLVKRMQYQAAQHYFYHTGST